MTIGGWVFFGIMCFVILVGGFGIAAIFESGVSKVMVIILTIAIILGMLFGMRWYFNNTASGQRQLIDQRSNLANGLDRVVRVYTANGDVIAEYEGIIDIEANDGGYIKFDFEGKRYMYYNCFVESIANIE